jgi:hypothetical protein
MKNTIIQGITRTVILTALILLVSISFTSCDFFKSDTHANQPKKCLIVIKDESASINESEDNKQKQSIWIKRHLKDNFSAGTDILILSVNSASNSAINHQYLLWQKDENQSESEYQSDTDKLLNDSKKATNDRLQLRKLQKQLLEKLFNQSNLVKSNQTQIIELLPQIDKLTREYDQTQMLLLTDAFQESSIRNFNATYPKTKNKAEEFAEADSQKITKLFDVQNDVLKKVISIHFLVPPGTNSQSLVITQYYFQEFFKQYGFSDDIKWETP